MIEEVQKTDISSFTLSEFLGEIKRELDRKFKGGGYWVRGELSDWRKSGVHYYGELIEFDDRTHQSVAKVRINMWAGTAKKIIPKFHNATGEEIKSGMKVLFLVDVSFHQNFGLSLNIIDIDPTFTLGDREARKNKIIADLTNSCVINNNRKLELPNEFNNVAVISSENAAGLGDFFVEADLLKKHKLCNFDVYNASMQGQDCPITVAKRLREIYKSIDSQSKTYDCIVLIRGGGSQADLDWFNYFDPANAICHMQVPVFVAIGHERDTTVLDSLAAKSFDTPSKVINFIANTIVNNANKAKSNFDSIKSISSNVTEKARLELTKNNEYIINFAKQAIVNQSKAIDDYNKLTNINAKKLIEHEKQQLNNFHSNSKAMAKSFIKAQEQQLSNCKGNIDIYAKNSIVSAKNNIENHYKGILSMSIEPTLQRGFAVTQSNGKYITSASDAKNQKNITITYLDGQIKTEVRNV